MSDSVRQHTEIIEAFKKGNSIIVEGLVRANAEKGRDILVEQISREKGRHEINQ
jgi:DNA-binding GntR family transcriptional regulator